MKHKKSQGLNLETIVIAVLLLVVLFLVIFFFSSSFGKQAEGTKSKITCLNQDQDNDGVNDFVDSCCPGASSGVNIKGCGPNDNETRKCGC